MGMVRGAGPLGGQEFWQRARWESAPGGVRGRWGSRWEVGPLASGPVSWLTIEIHLVGRFLHCFRQEIGSLGRRSVGVLWNIFARGQFVTNCLVVAYGVGLNFEPLRISTVYLLVVCEIVAASTYPCRSMSGTQTGALAQIQ